MIRFQFNQLKGTITQALIVVKSVEIDDFWTLDMSISTLDMSVSTLDMSVSTLDMLLSTLDSRQLPRLVFFFISRSNFLIYESKTTLCLRRTGILGMYEWLVHNTFNIIRRNPNPKPSAHISPLVSETETAFTFVF